MILIDSTLASIWKKLGLTKDEIEMEVSKLRSDLTNTYNQFVGKSNALLMTAQDDMNKQLEELSRIKAMIGETGHVVKTNDPSKSYRQIQTEINSTFAQLNTKKKKREAVFLTLQKEIKSGLDRIGIEESEYDEIGEDLTPERMERWQQRLKRLRAELRQRNAIHNGYKSAIQRLSEQMNETVASNLVAMFDKAMIDDESLEILSGVANKLQRVFDDRQMECDVLIDEIKRNSKVLMIPEAEVRRRPEKLTEEEIAKLRSEAQALSKRVLDDAEAVAIKAQTEVDEICDTMRVPERLRPRYAGDNLIDRAKFYQKILEDMKQRLIKAKPITDLIFKIEQAKNWARNSDSEDALARTVDERKTFNLKKLEKQLLELLLKFRQVNGFDFEFNGVTYIDTLSEYKLQNKRKLGATVLKGTMDDPPILAAAKKAATPQPKRAKPK